MFLNFCKLLSEFQLLLTIKDIKISHKLKEKIFPTQSKIILRPKREAQMLMRVPECLCSPQKSSATTKNIQLKMFKTSQQQYSSVEIINQRGKCEETDSETHRVA